METTLEKYISETFNISIPASVSDTTLIAILAEKINELILHDFPFLLRILYRIDVSEQKLKILLKEHTDTDAGKIIATMIIQRQKEKINSKELYRRGTTGSEDAESW